MDDDKLLKKRFCELAKKAYNGGYFTFTDFLGLAEQTSFAEILNEIHGIRYTAFGGAEGAERVMIRFGDPEELGYEEEFPITCIKAEPVAPKFADKLTHRDFLGALLNLGIERSTLGDIPIIDNVGYIFAKDDIANYISEALIRVKNTDVRASVCKKLPEGELYKTEAVKIQLSGIRIDAAVSKVFAISREASLSLFKKGLVFVNGKECTNNSYQPKTDDVISVRGFGRFIWCSEVGLSRKGKLIIEIKVYK